MSVRGLWEGSGWAAVGPQAANLTLMVSIATTGRVKGAVRLNPWHAVDFTSLIPPFRLGLVPAERQVMATNAVQDIPLQFFKSFRRFKKNWREWKVAERSHHLFS